MLGLFGNVAEMGFQIKGVSAPAKLVGGVILYAQPALLRGAIESPQSEGVRMQFAYLREAVAIIIIGLAVTIALIQR